MSLFQRLKEVFLVSDPNQPDQAIQPQLARAMILLEAALYDDEFAEEEHTLILLLLQQRYALTHDEIEELIELAQTRRKEFPDIQSLTREMVTRMTPSDRIELMTEIWQVVFADDRVEPNEELFVGKMKTLLRLDHKDWIFAKLKAKDLSA